MSFLDKLKAYAFQILSLVLLVALVAVGWRMYAARIDAEKARSTLSAEQADRANENTQRMRVALDDARETFRRSEVHARNQQGIADEHAKQERRRNAALAAAVRDGEQLRNQVRQFAAACGGGEAESFAAALRDCQHRAATLGELYDQADRQAEEFADAAEKHADDVRTMKAIILNDRMLLEVAN